MAKVSALAAYKILDANGSWAIEAKLVFGDNSTVKASLPLVSNVLVEAADNLKLVNKLIKQVEQIISPELIGLEVEKDFALVVDELLGQIKSGQTSLLGQGSLLVSILAARAGALVSQLPLYQYLDQTYDLEQVVYTLPTPLFTIFNGGSFADTNLDFEEYLLVPLSKNKTGFTEKLANAGKVFNQLAGILLEAGLDTDTGSEGGYAPDMSSSVKALEFLSKAIVEAGFVLDHDFGLGLDIGSHHLYQPETGQYVFKLDHACLRTETLVNLYRDWLSEQPLVYLEDGLAPTDQVGWSSLTKQLGEKIIIAGDQLFNNNIKLFRNSLKGNLANAAVLRLGDLPRLQDLLEFAKLVKRHNYGLILSHSYGETVDDFLADLAVAVGADYLKAGSLARGERVVKYNRLLEIAHNLNDQIV